MQKNATIKNYKEKPGSNCYIYNNVLTQKA